MKWMARIKNWLGLETNQRNHPRHVEFIMASSGRAAYTMRLNIYYLHWALVGLVFMALFWLGGLSWAAYYHYVNSNAVSKMVAVELQVKRLEQYNSELAKSKLVLTSHYQSMMDKLGGLESTVRTLAHRYHFGNLEKPTALPVAGGVGGIAYPMPAEQAIIAFQQQTQSRIGDLQQVLAHIMARPQGWPISHDAEITSRFGVRANPFGDGTYEFHKGLDFAAKFATPVLVTAPGVVVEAGLMGENGNLVEVDHGYGYRTGYAHLSQIKVKVGELVKAGQILGLSGSTGRSTGPHLHYAVFFNGTLIDPYPFIE